jgi:hypothetical protein
MQSEIGSGTSGVVPTTLKNSMGFNVATGSLMKVLSRQAGQWVRRLKTAAITILDINLLGS